HRRRKPGQDKPARRALARRVDAREADRPFARVVPPVILPFGLDHPTWPLWDSPGQGGDLLRELGARQAQRDAHRIEGRLELELAYDAEHPLAVTRGRVADRGRAGGR